MLTAVTDKSLNTFLKLYFIDCVITLVSIFLHCPLPPSPTHSLRPSPHHCSCPWVMCIGSLATPFPILYFTSPWLFCNYLFGLLNPLTSSPIPHTPLPSSNNQNTLHIHDSVSVLICLVRFLDSIFDRYVFLTILFIVLISFFLSRPFNISYNNGLVMINSFSFSLSGSSLSAL